MQTLKPEEFIGLAADHVIPGPTFLAMFGFDTEKCQVVVTDKGYLSVTEGDEALESRLSIAPPCWCYTKDFDAAPG
jgi:hypothetical protein